jgi:hypothetical protein
MENLTALSQNLRLVANNLACDAKLARVDAHAAFDWLWKCGGMSRTAAYQRLAKHMRLKEKDCHIRYFTVEQCLQVQRFAERIRARK